MVSINVAIWTVSYRETDGLQGGHAVTYAPFDSENQLAATIADLTPGSGLTKAPTLGCDNTASPRGDLSLATVVTGQSGESPTLSTPVSTPGRRRA